MLEALPGLLILLAISGVLYFCLLVALICWKLTHPPRRTYVSAVARGIAGEPDELDPPITSTSWLLRSRGRDLPVWDCVGGNPVGPVIIFTHGWGDSRIGALCRMPHLMSLASRLLAFDLPGHGEADGLCRLGLHEHLDLIALIDHIKVERVVLFGWSMGAGISIEAALARPAVVAGIIAEAPYRVPITPARNVLRAGRLPSGLSLHAAMRVLGFGQARVHAFNRASLAQRLSCPLLVLHGQRDTISPEADGREIAAAVNATFVSIEGGTHNGLWIRPETVPACVEAVRGFAPLTS